jgi:exopolysaccharide biosynthesis polyprenyl glycosylphosphotransferase
MTIRTPTPAAEPAGEPRFARRRLVRLPGRRLLSIFDAPSRPAVSARDRLFRRSLATADALAATLALFIGVAVIGEDAIKPGAALFVPLALVLSKCVGLYDRDELLLNKTTLDDTPALFQLATVYTLLVWLLEPIVVEGYLGREQVLGLWLLLIVAGLSGRFLARELARRSTAAERCLLVGDAEAADRLEQQLADTHGVKARIAQRIDTEADDLETTTRRIEHAVQAHEIHRVVLAPRTVDSDGVLDTIRVSKALGVKVSLFPRVFEVVGSSVEFDELHGMTVLGLRRSGLSRSSWMLKRAMDWTGALIILGASSVLMVVIALAIKLETRGPVLFRQTRVGRDGRRFEMLKFRTMVHDAEALRPHLEHRNEADGLFKIADDPRVTRVGRLLRRMSLDELPQMINVLRGEMSLVGPRPLVADEDDKVEGWDRRRLQLTPGITGPWQILGSSRVPLREMVKIDYLYVANWSLWGDVKVLLRTIPYMARRRGM